MATKHLLPSRAATSTILARIHLGRALSTSAPKARIPATRSNIPTHTFTPVTGPKDDTPSNDPAVRSSGDSKDQRTSTITSAEQRILDEIQRGLTLNESTDASKSGSGPVSTIKSYEDLDELRVLALFSDGSHYQRDEQSDLSQDKGKGLHSQEVEAGNVSPSLTYDELVDKHARQIIRIIGKRIKGTVHNKSFPPDLHSMFPQGHDENAIMSVDFATWKVCEDLIFPMIEILDAPSTNPSAVKPGKDLSAQGTQPQIPKSTEENPVLRAQHLLGLPGKLPDGVRSHSIILRVYPAAVLLALRWIVKCKPTSPYALALLPRIRALGSTSYVLGGTVSFYNTLIKLYWDICSDLRVIDGLLHEMERGGIEWDIETLEVLSLIEADRSADLQVSSTQAKNRPGSRSARWWQRSLQVEGYETVCVQWRRKIVHRLAEKGWAGNVQEDVKVLPMTPSELRQPQQTAQYLPFS